MTLSNIDRSRIRLAISKLEALKESDDNEFITDKKEWQTGMIEQSINVLNLIKPY